MSSLLPDSSATPPPAPVRRKRIRASDEAVMTLSKPIANWQAKLAWKSASWGLIPVLGFPLGFVGLVLGCLGWLRIRRQPEDLGIRHAMGGMILGGLEFATNVAGISCVVKGVLNIS